MCLRFWNLWAGGANKRAKIPYTGCQGNKEQGVAAALEQAGFTVAVNRDLPPNDGCISFGQAVVAWASSKEEGEQPCA